MNMPTTSEQIEEAEQIAHKEGREAMKEDVLDSIRARINELRIEANNLEDIWFRIGQINA